MFIEKRAGVCGECSPHEVSVTFSVQSGMAGSQVGLHFKYVQRRSMESKRGRV